MTKSYSLNVVIAALGILAMMFAFTPVTALANGGGGHHRGGDDVDVTNHNGAIVLNGVSASANTGGNDAGGADGGDGGDVNHSDDDNDGGNGGDAGGADSGGFVDTGDAGATAGVLNVVNTNDTKVDLCGCRGGDDGDVEVRNRNHAFVGNHVDADADTGDNWAGGADGGDGGDVNHSDDDNDGGNGGGGGEGGTVYTGLAVSEAGAVNVVNRNVTRVRR